MSMLQAFCCRCQNVSCLVSESHLLACTPHVVTVLCAHLAVSLQTTRCFWLVRRLCFIVERESKPERCQCLPSLETYSGLNLVLSNQSNKALEKPLSADESRFLLPVCCWKLSRPCTASRRTSAAGAYQKTGLDIDLAEPFGFEDFGLWPRFASAYAA